MTSCRVTGEAQVIASHVYADELQVRPVAGGGFQVVVVDAVQPCLTVDVAPDGRPLGGPMLGECPPASPPGEATATNGVATYVAHETFGDSDSRYLTVGVVTYDWPHAYAGIARPGRATVVEHPFQAGSTAGDETEPKLSPAVGDSVVLVWIQGDEVLAQPLFRSADPAGPPLNVSQQGQIEVEHPGVAFAPTQSGSSDGVVAYAARTPTGFHVLATPITCSSGRDVPTLVARR